MYRAKRLSQMFDRTRNTSLHLMRNLSVLMVTVQGENSQAFLNVKNHIESSSFVGFYIFAASWWSLNFFFFLTPGSIEIGLHETKEMIISFDCLQFQNEVGQENLTLFFQQIFLRKLMQSIKNLLPRNQSPFGSNYY